MAVYDGSLPTALKSVFPDVDFESAKFMNIDKSIAQVIT